MLIARRAFFLPPLVRLHCTARIPACDSACLEFYRITVRFFFYRYRFRIALFYVYRMHARAIFVRASFAVSRIHLRFVRAFSA